MSTPTTIQFPEFSGIRCLMMPYIQGDPNSVPDEFIGSYFDILKDVFLEKGKVGYLTIDESLVEANKPHRGKRANHERALHTEAGLIGGLYCWGTTPVWGGLYNVTLERDLEILIANSIDDSCAVWMNEEENTSADGDIGHLSHLYPYKNSHIMKAGEVCKLGILNPHESLPIKNGGMRQFLRIVGEGVRGRESYFTTNPILQ